MTQEPKHIVVIGTSAGGLEALIEILSGLDKSLDIAVFVVMHLSRLSIGDFLIHRLKKYTKLSCLVPSNGSPIERGNIYIAPPNYHLLLKAGEIVVGHGPEENRWRPSIDVLFRSAAAYYDSRVIGVILTGLLDDGAEGMLAIKRCGGRTIVQDPKEAAYPNMPLAVLNTMEVDECAQLSEIARKIASFSQIENRIRVPIPEDIKNEAEIVEKVIIGIDVVSSVGKQTVYNCPVCGGSLWRTKNGTLEHYRCHIGHAYSENDLYLKQTESIESTLWVAIRIMEERRKLLKQMEEGAENKGFMRLLAEYRSKREELDSHIDRLKELLFSVQRTDEDGQNSGG